jgi:hypothetical protein
MRLRSLLLRRTKSQAALVEQVSEILENCGMPNLPNPSPYPVKMHNSLAPGMSQRYEREISVLGLALLLLKLPGAADELLSHSYQAC